MRPPQRQTVLRQGISDALPAWLEAGEQDVGFALSDPNEEPAGVPFKVHALIPFTDCVLPPGVCWDRSGAAIPVCHGSKPQAASAYRRIRRRAVHRGGAGGVDGGWGCVCQVARKKDLVRAPGPSRILNKKTGEG